MSWKALSSHCYSSPHVSQLWSLKITDSESLAWSWELYGMAPAVFCARAKVKSCPFMINKLQQILVYTWFLLWFAFICWFWGPIVYIDYKVIHGAVGIQKTEPSRCAQLIVRCNATKTEERCFCWQPWMAGQPWITYENLSGPRNSTQISR